MTRPDKWSRPQVMLAGSKLPAQLFQGWCFTTATSTGRLRCAPLHLKAFVAPPREPANSLPSVSCFSMRIGQCFLFLDLHSSSFHEYPFLLRHDWWQAIELLGRGHARMTAAMVLMTISAVRDDSFICDCKPWSQLISLASLFAAASAASLRRTSANCSGERKDIIPLD